MQDSYGIGQLLSWYAVEDPDVRLIQCLSLAVLLMPSVASDNSSNFQARQADT